MINIKDNNNAKYKILSHLTSGGMAELYLAQTNDVYKKIVVLKSVSQQMIDSDLDLKYFKREIQISSQLEHPNVIKYYDTWEYHGKIYLVLEYVSGANLKTVVQSLSSQNLLPIAAILYLFTQIASGISFLHSKKIIHRDISPSNILVTKQGDVKIIDFGISKKISESNTTFVGGIKGKYKYLSPEQAKISHISYGTDIFQLGLLFYELYMGCSFFYGMNDRDILFFLDQLSLEKIESRLDKIPQDYKKLLLEMLNPEFENRISAEALLTKTSLLLNQVFPNYKRDDFIFDLHLQNLEIIEATDFSIDQSKQDEPTINISENKPNYTNEYYLSLSKQTAEKLRLNFVNVGVPAVIFALFLAAPQAIEFKETIQKPEKQLRSTASVNPIPAEIVSKKTLIKKKPIKK